jgi:hypothetical protein
MSDDYDPNTTDDEFKLVAVRKAAANDINDEIYTGTLEDKGFTHQQCEEVFEYFREIIGAYKLEFDWGCSLWVDNDHTKHEGFSYTGFKDYDDNALTVWWQDPPVSIRFGMDDMRRAVREYATSYDEDKDGSEILVRRETLQMLRSWYDCINTLIVEIEDELK